MCVPIRTIHLESARLSLESLQQGESKKRRYLHPAADKGTLGAAQRSHPTVAVIRIVLHGRKGADGELLPVVDVLELENRVGETFALSSIPFREGDAEVADAGVVEVLAAAYNLESVSTT